MSIVETMQKQDRYRAIQALMDHLDAKAKESCDLKQGILDTLSQCVAVAADGSLGEDGVKLTNTQIETIASACYMCVICSWICFSLVPRHSRRGNTLNLECLGVRLGSDLDPSPGFS